MIDPLRNWAEMEQGRIEEEIAWFDAGAMLISPSCDDITEKKLADLKARQWHLDRLLKKKPDA